MAEIKYNDGTSWTAITANDISAADLTTANLCSAYLNGCYLYMGTKVVSPNNATEATIFLEADFKTTFHTTSPISCGVAFMNGHYEASGNIGAVNSEYWDSGSWKGWHARWVNSKTGSTRINWIVVVPESAHDTSYDTTVSTTNKIKYLNSENQWVELAPSYFNAATAQALHKMEEQLGGIYVKAGSFVKNIGSSVTTTQLWNTSTYKSRFHTTGDGFSVVSDGDHGSQPVWLMGTEWRNSTWYARWESSSSKSDNKRFNYITFVNANNHTTESDISTVTSQKVKYLNNATWTNITPADIGAGTQSDLDEIYNHFKSQYDSGGYDADGVYIYAGTIVRQSSYYHSQGQDYSNSYARVWSDADFKSNFHASNCGECSVIIMDGAASSHPLGPLGSGYRNSGNYPGWYAQWNNNLIGFPKRFTYIVMVPAGLHTS